MSLVTPSMIFLAHFNTYLEHIKIKMRYVGSIKSGMDLTEKEEK